MAIGKIWNIKSTFGNDVKASVNYIFNDKKTTYEVNSIEIEDEQGKPLAKEDALTMLREIGYVENSVKTRECEFTGSINCTKENATEEFKQTCTHYNKTSGRLLSHMVMSFPSDEKDVSKIWAAGSQWAKEICGDNYQGVFAMHLNTDNYHIHLLINAVGLDGRKFHMDKRYVSDILQPAINKACRDNGLSENMNFGKKFEESSMNYADWNNQMRHDIDEAIEHSFNFADFKGYLQSLGYVVNVGKHISLRAEGHEMGKMSQARRTGKLGQIYTPESIEKRLQLKEEELVVDFYEKLPATQTAQIFGVAMARENPKMKKWADMNWMEKEQVRAEFRRGHNPWNNATRMNWKEFQRIQSHMKVLNGITALKKYGCTDIKDIPETLEKIRNLEKEQNTHLSEIKSQMKITKDIRKIYSEIKDIESRALLYDLYGDENYKSYATRYHELTFRLEAHFGKTYEEIYKYIHDQEVVKEVVEENKKILANDAKLCINILKEFDKAAKSIALLDGANIKNISQIIAYDSGSAALVDVRSIAKSIQKLGGQGSNNLESIGAMPIDKRFRHVDTVFTEAPLTQAEELVRQLGGKIDRNTWTWISGEESKAKVSEAIHNTHIDELNNVEVFCSVRSSDVIIKDDMALIRVPSSHKKDGEYETTKKDALSGAYISVAKNALAESKNGGYTFSLNLGKIYDIYDKEGNVKTIPSLNTSKVPGTIAGEHFTIKAIRTIYTGKVRKVGDTVISFNKEDLCFKDDGIYRFKIADDLFIDVSLVDIELLCDPNWGTTYKININDTAVYTVRNSSGSELSIKGSDIRVAAQQTYEVNQEEPTKTHGLKR